MGIDPEELNDIIIQIDDKLRSELYKANRGGEEEIITALKRWHYNYENEDNFEEESNRILVVGKSEVEKKYLIKIIESLSLNPEDFNFILEYENNFDFGSLKNSKTYSDVIVGPMGHNQKGDRSAGSNIEEMVQNPDEYPNTIKCVTSGDKLKITSRSFQEALLKTNVYGRMMAFWGEE